MIFKRDDIEFYEITNSESNELVSYRLHKPSGVFFAKYINLVPLFEGENNFKFFKIAALNQDSTLSNEKNFDGKTEKNFFEAVKYFESLINKRTPPPKQDPPSIGIFVFSKGDKLVSFIKLSDLVVEMSNEDVYKSFTPPKSKPFGRLNITVLDDPKYDPVKYKFACNYDEKLSKELSESSGVSIDDVFVYQLTPYQTQEDAESNPDQNPESVSDEQLTPDQIEGETPDDLKGNPDDSQEGEPGEDGEPGEPGEEGQQQQQQQQQGQPGEPGEDGQPGEPGEEGQPGQPGQQQQQRQQPGQPGEPGEDGEEGEPGEEGQPGQPGQPVQPGQTGQPGEPVEDDQSTARGYDQPQERQQETSSDFRKNLSSTLGVEDVAYAYGRQDRLVNKIRSLNDSALEPIYKSLGITETGIEGKTKLIEEVTRITKPYFE